MESTPDTVNDEKISLMKKMGVNRISMGVQRMDDEWLKEMGRKHTSADVLKALDTFNRNDMRFNVDLIYGFEGQSVESFCKDLLRLLESKPSEVTLYRYENQKRTDDRSIKTVERNQNREDIYAMQEAGRQILQSLGYTEGPDGWFTRPGVNRAKVYDDRWKNQKPMIAFGAEGYSFSADQQHTNKKHVEYHDALKKGDSLLDDKRVYEYLGEQKDLRRMVFDLKSTFQTDFNEEERALFSGLADKGFGTIENNNHFKLGNKGIIVVEEIMRVLVDKSRELGEK